MIGHPGPQNKMPLFSKVKMEYISNYSILFKLKKKLKVINSLNLPFLMNSFSKNCWFQMEMNFI